MEMSWVSRVMDYLYVDHVYGNCAMQEFVM